MKNIRQILNENGPEDIFIFYSFLLINRKNEIVVSNLKEIRKVFLMELKSSKRKYSHLQKNIRSDLKRDIVKSYLYIKTQLSN